MMYVSHIIMLYILNSYSAVCHLYLSKSGRKKIIYIHVYIYKGNKTKTYLVCLQPSWRREQWEGGWKIHRGCRVRPWEKRTMDGPQFIVKMLRCLDMTL